MQVASLPDLSKQPVHLLVVQLVVNVDTADNDGFHLLAQAAIQQRERRIAH